MSIDVIEDTENIEKILMQKETIIRLFREKGCRITKQRKIILDIILEEDCTCCKEIYYKALSYDQSIGIATVYRMINTLEEIGAINRKNTYRIEGNEACQKYKRCIIVLDDNKKCCLDKKELEKVMQAGLYAYGLIEKQNISKIELE